MSFYITENTISKVKSTKNDAKSQNLTQRFSQRSKTRGEFKGEYDLIDQNFVKVIFFSSRSQNVDSEGHLLKTPI